MPLLIHGIVDADVSVPTAVPPDEDVSSVVHGAIAAIVRPTPDHDVLPSRANLLAHTRVLESLATATTVLPMRFGMVVDDEQVLVDGYLAPQQDDLVAALERLRGHVELRLRGRYDEEAVLREVVAADPGLARLKGRGSMDARMRLGERVVDALGTHVAGVVAGGVAEPLDAFSLSLLVAEDGMVGFDDAIDELGQEVAPALALELVGPVPPFSFTAPEGAPA
jgi:hypothetical protein